jgi:hypothetical protein
MDLTEEIRKIAEGLPAELKEDKKGFSLEWVVAERKSFLSKPKPSRPATGSCIPFFNTSGLN